MALAASIVKDAKAQVKMAEELMSVTSVADLTQDDLSELRAKVKSATQIATLQKKLEGITAGPAGDEVLPKLQNTVEKLVAWAGTVLCPNVQEAFKAITSFMNQQVPLPDDLPLEISDIFRLRCS